jgi:2,4-dienoyl-CoA reductase-like NADH-dependent reductase (Old Yellow Enzyme family)
MLRSFAVRRERWLSLSWCRVSGWALFAAAAGSHRRRGRRSGRGIRWPFAETIRRDGKITVQAVGMIADPHQAEAIIAERRADCVALARAFLDDPRWSWHAADALGADIACPPQYARSRPNQWSGAALAHPHRGSGR